MKQLDPVNNPKADDIQEERQEIKNIGLVCDIDVPKGLDLFTYDTKTAEVKKAEYKIENKIDFTRVGYGTDGNSLVSGVRVKGSLIYNEELIYFPALNLKSAKKKASDVDSFFKWLAKREEEKENRDTL